MIENGENIRDLRPYVQLINHIHLSEPYLKPVQKRSIHQEIKTLKYKGYVSIEMSRIDDIEQLKKIILYAKEAIL